MRKALMSATVPVSVSARAVPPTDTPAPDVAASVPEGTLRVTVTAIAPDAESGSATARPTSGFARLTVWVKDAGSVLTGASLIAVTVTNTVAVSVTPPEVTV